MNIAKHMELIFVGTLVLALGASYAIAAPAAHVPIVSKTAAGKMPTVYVVGKRLTAEQKAKLGA